MNFKEALIAHLQCEKVEVREGDGYSWQAFGDYYSHTRLETFTTKWYAAGFQFRLAPRTILVNGVEVPAPESVEPSDGTVCFVPDITKSSLQSSFTWMDYEDCRELLKKDILYLKEDNAIARAKAMLIVQSK